MEDHARTILYHGAIGLRLLAPSHINLVTQKNVDKQFLQRQQLMLISFNGWKKLLDTESQWLPDIPTTVILADK